MRFFQSLRLLVDAMLPDFLLSTCTIRAGTENGLHLLDTSEQNLACDEPTNALGARRAGERALVCPELAERLDSVERRGEVNADVFDNIHLVEADHRGKLREEFVVSVARVETDGQNGNFVSLSIDVDEMKFGLAAVAADRMIGRGVNMPALEVGGHVVVGETGVGRPVAVVFNVESRSISPVQKFTSNAAVVAVAEGGYVVERQAVVQREGDWGLLGSGLAEGVIGVDLAPVEGRLVSPIVLCAVGALCGVLIWVGLAGNQFRTLAIVVRRALRAC